MHARSAPLAAAGLLILSCLVASCGGTKGPSIQIKVAKRAAGGAERCNTQAIRNGDPLSMLPWEKLRVTLRSRPANGGPARFCDYIVTNPNTLPYLRVGSEDAGSIDIFAEVFTEPPNEPFARRIATGALVGLDPRAENVAPLRLYATDAFRCAATQLGQARAFHTATRLPDGRVLFVGGLVSSTVNPTENLVPATGATATGTAELYDPRDQSLIAITEAVKPQGRAFHAARLLDGSGPCAAGQHGVLLVGGLGPTTEGGPVLTRSAGLAGTRLSPFSNETLPKPLGVRALSNEVLCLDTATAAATRVPVGGAAAIFRAVGEDASGLVAAGGVQYEASMLNVESPRTERAAFSATSGEPTLGTVPNPRPGASLTILPDGRGLLWGGGLAPPSTGELFDPLRATTPPTLVFASYSALTQFHTATMLEDAAPSVLITGGFEVTSGGVNTQPPTPARAVRRVSVLPGGALSTPVRIAGYEADNPLMPCTVDRRYRPAGWESAVALSRGRVLITGGAPSTLRDTSTTAPKCVDCVDGTSSLLCALPQASLYEDGSVSISPAAEALGVPRFGHTSTVLVDGTVLIAGGFGGEPVGEGVSPVFVGDLELYNPRTQRPPFDPSVSLVDPDDPIAEELTGDGGSGNNLVRVPALLIGTPEAPFKPALECSTLR